MRGAQPPSPSPPVFSKKNEKERKRRALFLKLLSIKPIFLYGVTVGRRLGFPPLHCYGGYGTTVYLYFYHFDDRKGRRKEYNDKGDDDDVYI